jgi:heme-degrading monooxygenase HmoA
MIMRVWRGFAPRKTRDAYPRHLLDTVRPKLEGIAGFIGLYLLRRDHSDEVEYQVLTMWESMDAVHAFAGDDPERAVVEPEAAAVLTRFDAEVRHYDVLAGPTIDSLL